MLVINMFNNGAKKSNDIVEKNRDMRKQLSEHEKQLFEKMSTGDPGEARKLAKRMLKMLLEAHS